MTLGPGREVCRAKVAYPSSGMAALGAQEFMQIRGVERMAAYKCPFCADWHLSKQIRGENSPTLLVVERAEHWKTRNDIVRDRKKRRLRGKLEQERQARQRFLGNEES